MTLVTGDRVRLRMSDGQVQVLGAQGGSGRAGMQFLSEDQDGDAYVIPADTLSLVDSGRVDRRLFDVSDLAKEGYDDKTRADLPLIVGYAAGSQAQSAAARVSGASGRVTRSLPSIGADAVDVQKSDAARVWGTLTGRSSALSAVALASGVSRIWLDAEQRVSLDQNVTQIGAPQAWRLGYTGQGVTIAVLDTGIDADHPDLADAVVGAQDFTGSASGTKDMFGHGTHVAGIITGNGAASSGEHVGVAPDAKLLNGKVLDDDGEGLDSDIIAGMQWAVGQGARVVNLSIDSNAPDDGTTPLDVAINQLSEQSGTLFVVAAGNDGPGASSIGSPGGADDALTVGAVDGQDKLANFSSRGPRPVNLAIKPDVTAPGVDIVSTLADGSTIASEYPAVDGRYVSLSGTSMATPHAAGAAAILAGEHPDWNGSQLKAALMNSADPGAGLTVYEQGAGRVDVARAVAQSVYATPASLSDGLIAWPHGDDPAIDHAVTYHNDGATAVTLNLTTDVRDPQGQPAPTGMVSLDHDQLTVPAHGSAVAHLTEDTSVPAPVGSYSGVLVATDGPVSTRTPFGFTLEQESYNVTLRAIDRTGAPASDYLARLVNLDTGQVFPTPYDPSGTAVIRVPKGNYYFATQVNTPDADSPWGADVAVEAEPTVPVTADVTLVADGRSAKPVGFTTDRPDAVAVGGELDFVRDLASGQTSLEYLGPPTGIFVRPSTTSAPAGQFTFRAEADYARPGTGGDFSTSPYLYHLSHNQDGVVPSTLTWRVHDQDLATVTTHIAAGAPNQFVVSDGDVASPAPGTLTEHYTAGIPWSDWVEGYPNGADPTTDPSVWLQESVPVTYRAGTTTSRTWNDAVFGPSFPDFPDQLSNGNATIGRIGDTISLLGLPLFSDSPMRHAGYSDMDTFTITLARDGQQIDGCLSPENFCQFTVPAASGSYHLATTATRSDATLSTQVSVAWTFASTTTPTTAEVALPVTAVRFAPRLDQWNRAPAGTRFNVPVYLQRQAGAAYGDVTGLSVQVSTDDGATWRPATVTGTGLNRTVQINNPTSGYVSLRATSSDSAGNTVEQTIIRAYAVGG